MISSGLAARLKDAGLVWRPASGDRFRLQAAEFDGDVFTVSDMTIEPHEFETGTILGFNGTTEWALDSVALDAALWLPREDQLRERLGGTFVSLTAPTTAGGRFVVTTRRAGDTAEHTGDEPAEAYGEALLALVTLAEAPAEA